MRRLLSIGLSLFIPCVSWSVSRPDIFQEQALQSGEVLFTHPLSPSAWFKGYQIFKQFQNATAREVFSRSVSGWRVAILPKESEFLNQARISAFGHQGYFQMMDRIAMRPGQKRLVMVMGLDTREAAPAVRDQILKGWQAAATQKNVQLEVIDLGVMPKPMVQLAIRHYQADGGSLVTASHNEPHFIGAEPLTGVHEPAGSTTGGALFDVTRADGLIRQFEKIRHDFLRWLVLEWRLGRIDLQSVSRVSVPGNQLQSQVEAAYQGYVKRLFGVKRLEKLRGFRILLNVNGGAAMGFDKRVFESLGMEVVEIGADRLGQFDGQRVEPHEEDFVRMSEQVAENKCELGIIFDADADRGYLVFPPGVLPDGKRVLFPQEFTAFNATMLLALRDSEGSGLQAGFTMIAHDANTYGLEQIAEAFNRSKGGSYVKVRRVGVGEANVVRAMQEDGAQIGMEGANGGLILGKESTCRDGVTMGILAALALRDPVIGARWVSVSGHYNNRPRTPLSLKTILNALPQRVTVTEKVSDLEVPLMDIRQQFEDRFRRQWENPLDSIHTRYESFELSYTFDTTVVSRLSGASGGSIYTHRDIPDRPDAGMSLVLIRRDGQKEFVWFRASATEPGVVRYQVDAINRFSFGYLLELFGSNFALSAYSRETTRKFFSDSFKAIVRSVVPDMKQEPSFQNAVVLERVLTSAAVFAQKRSGVSVEMRLFGNIKYLRRFIPLSNDVDMALIYDDSDPEFQYFGRVLQQTVREAFIEGLIDAARDIPGWQAISHGSEFPEIVFPGESGVSESVIIELSMIPATQEKEWGLFRAPKHLHRFLQPSAPHAAVFGLLSAAAYLWDDFQLHEEMVQDFLATRFNGAPDWAGYLQRWSYVSSQLKHYLANADPDVVTEKIINSLRRPLMDTLCRAA